MRLDSGTAKCSVRCVRSGAKIQSDAAGTSSAPNKSVDIEVPPERSSDNASEIHTILLRSEPATIPASERKTVFGLQNTNRPIEFITNAFEDRGETVLDHATGLLWQKAGLELSTSAEETQAYIRSVEC
jgi:hypothetical protein